MYTCTHSFACMYPLICICRPKKVRNNAVLMKPLNGVKGLSNSRNTTNNRQETFQYD